MAKKLLVIYGSHRPESNSAIAAEALISALPQGEFEVSRRYLSKLTVNNCIGCFACRKNGNICVHIDDAVGLLEEIAAADKVIITIPIFFSQAAATVTSFIHRGYNLLAGENGRYTLRIEPKDTIAIYSQGSPFPEEFATGIALTNRALSAMGLKVKDHMICTLANQPGNAKDRPDILQKAAELAEKLL
ncbi:MAG: NAD(P)H-dependent oxidoreductase [Oscillospiraceae bacterium]|nr:NAD(P)H-dependent oxidoreductase [Oscillospiraceae bacterium]